VNLPSSGGFHILNELIEEKTHRTKSLLLFPPHRTHASPVKWCSSFVVSKQSCQTIAVKAIDFLLHFHSIAFTAMAFSPALRGLSCCLQFLLIPHGSFCVLHATSFIPSSVTLHFTSFVAVHFASWHGLHCKHTAQRTCSHIPFRKAIPTILTGFHSASLRHPFTSVAFSPPAANNFARRLSPLRLRSLKCCANTQILTHGSFVPHFATQH